MVSCLLRRARTIAQGDNVIVEEHLRGVLERNTYLEAFTIMVSKLRCAWELAREHHTTALTPCVASLSEDVQQICRRHSILTTFCSAPTLCRQLMQVKDRDPLEKQFDDGVPRALQLWLHVIEDKESSNQRTQGCYQTRGNWKVSNWIACLGTP